MWIPSLFLVNKNEMINEAVLELAPGKLVAFCAILLVACGGMSTSDPAAP